MSTYAYPLGSAFLDLKQGQENLLQFFLQLEKILTCFLLMRCFDESGRLDLSLWLFCDGKGITLKGLKNARVFDVSLHN